MENENDLDKQINDLILKACNEVGYFNNEQMQLIEFPNGHLGFQFRQPENDVLIQYSPHNWLATFAKALDNDLYNPENADILEGLRVFHDDFLISLAKVLICNIQNELNEFFPVYHKLSAELTQLFECENHGAKELNLILDNFNEFRRKRLLKMCKDVEATKTAPQYLFSEIYQERNAMWREAKKLYTQIKNQRNVLEILEAAFPDLPPELLTHLQDLDAETRQPSSIALIDTADLLNVEFKSYTDLRRYERQSKEMRKSVSDETAAEALENYFQVSNERSQLTETMRQLTMNLKTMSN